ncbi:MAG: NUDIX hydrolase [Patescibacteria group bacterium]
MKNQWTTKKSRIVYNNDWITVREDVIVRKSGVHGTYGVVKTIGSSAIVALNDNMEIALIRQWRYPLRHETIELPWGGKQKRESHLSAAKRELREETGLSARSWKSIGYVNGCPGVVQEDTRLFLATGLRHHAFKLDMEEQHEKILTVPIQIAYRWASDGTINDATAIAGIVRVKKLLKI